MAKIKYYYDTETCRYERIKTTRLEFVLNTLGFLVVCAVFGVVFAGLYNRLFPTREVERLLKEKADLQLAHEILSTELAKTQQWVTELEERDNDIYRVLFEAEPIPLQVRQSASGGTQKFEELYKLNLTSHQMLISNLKKLETLKKRLYAQSKSYDEIVELAKRKNEMIASIPAIRPLSNKDLKSFASGFGMRIDPHYKTRRMHTGCDFSAPKGTPIYATGDGRVITAGWGGGYGKQVEIDHGFGYITKYAHMDKFNVIVGQKVKRGQKIGEVGNTGKSIAPHVHYEVIHNGNKIDPAHYFFSDITPQEYEEILKISSQENQALGY